MSNRINVFKKYGIGEYLLAVLGIVFFCSVGKEVVVRDWEEFTPSIILVMLTFVSIGSLLIIRPMSILDMARRRLGLETKKDKITSNKSGKNNDDDGGAVIPNKGF